MRMIDIIRYSVYADSSKSRCIADVPLRKREMPFLHPMTQPLRLLANEQVEKHMVPPTPHPLMWVNVAATYPTQIYK